MLKLQKTYAQRLLRHISFCNNNVKPSATLYYTLKRSAAVVDVLHWGEEQLNSELTDAETHSQVKYKTSIFYGKRPSCQWQSYSHEQLLYALFNKTFRYIFYYDIIYLFFFFFFYSQQHLRYFPLSLIYSGRLSSWYKVCSRASRKSCSQSCMYRSRGTGTVTCSATHCQSSPLHSMQYEWSLNSMIVWNVEWDFFSLMAHKYRR